MASAGGENASEGTFKRAGYLLLAELLQPAWSLFVEQNFFNETGVAEVLETQSESSPRPWGCFRHRDDRPDRALVFPTPVGVFLGV